MKKDIKKLIEEMDALIEDEMVDEFNPVEPTEMDLLDVEPVVLTRTEELEAKTKISRALDTLVQAIEDFKSATVVELGLLNQENLTQTIDGFDRIVKDITDVLDGNQKEEPMEQPEEEATEEQPEETVEEGSEEIKEEPQEDEEDEEDEFDFDAEASLDLFGTEE